MMIVRRSGALIIVVALVAAWLNQVGWAQNDDAKAGTGGGNAAEGNPAAFLIAPYVQLGDHPRLAEEESLVVMWHAADEDAAWEVQIAREGTEGWQSAGKAVGRRIAVGKIEPHRVYRASISGLHPAEKLTYRVMKNGGEVFRATAQARKHGDQPYRFIQVGDVGVGLPGQKKLAYLMERERPDLVVINGDIVYNCGEIPEYRDKIYPIYNRDQALHGEGGPMMRSIPFMPELGGHDYGFGEGWYPDRNAGLAYYYYWALPMNGPAVKVGGPNAYPLKKNVAEEAGMRALLAAMGENFPRTAHYSFDYGNAHWVMLDCAGHVNWKDPAMREWLRRDLQQAGDATWKFVCSYIPPFHSCKDYLDTEQMRVVADIWQETGVDVVFSGFAHSYQRTRPLRFDVDPGVFKADYPGPPWINPGAITLDTVYDGREQTDPNGIIYLTTAAGGARMFNPEATDNPAEWRDYTVHYNSLVFSFTVIDVDGKKLTLRQISENGDEIDRFVVTK